MRPIPEAKKKTFAKKYAQNGFNATQAVQDMHPHMKREVAKTRGHEIISNPHYQQAIKEYLEETEGNRQNRNTWMIRNAKQTHSYSSSNQAIDMLNKIAGDYAPEKHESVSVTLTGKELREAIRELTKELEDIA